MKSILSGLLVSLIIASQSPVQIRQEDVAASFKNIVDTISTFFQSNPKWLIKNEYSSKVYVRIDQFILISSSFDVQMTQSIISPYVGYVSLRLLHRVTKNCGDIEDWGSKWWDNVVSAVKHADSDSCFDEPSTYDVKFAFAFQEGTWVYKNIINLANGKDEIIIARALDKKPAESYSLSDTLHQQFNKKWSDLFGKIKEIKLSKVEK